MNGSDENKNLSLPENLGARGYSRGTTLVPHQKMGSEVLSRQKRALPDQET